jgi:hypothetical protein
MYLAKLALEVTGGMTKTGRETGSRLLRGADRLRRTIQARSRGIVT